MGWVFVQLVNYNTVSKKCCQDVDGAVLGLDCSESLRLDCSKSLWHGGFASLTLNFLNRESAATASLFASKEGFRGSDLIEFMWPWLEDLAFVDYDVLRALPATPDRIIFRLGCLRATSSGGAV